MELQGSMGPVPPGLGDAAPSAADGLRTGNAPPCVLVIEDDVEVSSQVCDVLASRGYAPIPIFQGPDALPAFLRHRPQAMIVDLMLPRMNGIQVLERVRRLPKGDQIPVLVISAVYRDPRAFRRDFERLGVREFLAKPFSLFRLVDSLDEALNSAVRMDPAQEGRPSPPGASQGDRPESEEEDRPAPETTAMGGVGAGLPAGDEAVEARVERLRQLAELACERRTGRLELWNDNGVRFDIALRQGEVVRAVTSEHTETAARQRVLAAVDREQMAARILGRLLEPPDLQWSFTPEPVVEAAIDLHEANLLRVLLQAVSQYLPFNTLADRLSQQAARVPRATPRFPAVMGRLALSPPLDQLPEWLANGLTVDALFNRTGAHSGSLVRLLWFLERAGAVRF